MKKISFLIILLLLLFPSISSPLMATSRGIKVTSIEGQSLFLYKDYHALVVGISSYEKWPKLPNAVNDAKEVAEKLRELGFTVRLALNPSSREMKTVLSEMVYKMGREENRALLFYYAGHGETETLADKTKMGYIIPRDCPLLEKNPMGFGTHAISMRDIESASMRIRSKHVVMLFDSCFSGSLFALVRAVPHDITEKSTLPVRQYITAGREDEQVPDKSMFKRCFLVGLEGDADLTGDGYITGSELGMYLSDKVVNYTHRRQHPQYGKINNPDLDRGDFIFIPLKIQRMEMAKEQKRQEEKSAIAEELKRLQEERKKSEALVEEMKRILEAKRRSEDMEKETLAEKRELEDTLKQAKENRQIDKAQMESKVKSLEYQLLASKEKLAREAAERGALEEELKRLKAERKKQALILKELQKKQSQEKRLVSIPKAVIEPQVFIVKLRDIPKKLSESQVKNMIEKHNFYEKYLNEKGNFPNDFLDNGNGTITDRVTGLMWEKGGSSSLLSYKEANKYISHLNKERFLGHDDWRIPTLEELCSLLEQKKNERGQHISPLFKDTQTKCLSADLFAEIRFVIRTVKCGVYNIANFTKGEIGITATENTRESWCQRLSVFFYIRAVRSIKGVQAEKRPNKLLTSIPKALGDTKALNGRFIAYANGRVVDTMTGLEWIAGPDKGTTYDEAISWAENLSIDGSDWRMPTLKELKSLYQHGAGNRNMTPLLKTTGWYVWGDEQPDELGSSWCFDFKNNSNYREHRERSFQNRAFAVRSQK